MILNKYYHVKGKYIATDWKRIECPSCGADTKQYAQVSTRIDIDEYVKADDPAQAQNRACFRYGPGGWAHVMTTGTSLTKRLQLNGMAQLPGMPE